MPPPIVETNVLATANEYATHANPKCVLACIEALQCVRQGQKILLDDAMRILTEYRRYASPKGQPGPGDLFMKWVWDNRANHNVCLPITITPTVNDPEDFEEFPKVSELATFDRNDRKWVAVAIASGMNPPILNAVDTDWWKHRKALERNAVHVEFLCPDMMACANMMA